MPTLLYSTYADWWPLLSAPEEYEEEAGAYAAILNSVCQTPPKTLLELGAGGGNNASYLKQQFQMTLTDVSANMQAVSQQLNPECEHIQGDMRSLRLGRTFDAVFVQDAIAYMTTPEDLRAAMETAYRHLVPGGAAIFVPDYTQETFTPSTSHGGHDGEQRSMRYLQWDRDPDPKDHSYDVEMVFLLSEHGKPIQTVHDHHTCGIFTIPEWFECLRAVGFEPDSVTLETDELECGMYRVFIGRVSP